MNNENVEEKVIIVKKYDEVGAHFKKHPILSLLFYGFGLVAFGFVACLFVIGAIIGIPLIIMGSIMMMLGVIGAFFKLILIVTKGKKSPHLSSRITDKTKKFGLLFPKFMRSKELQEKYP